MDGPESIYINIIIQRILIHNIIEKVHSFDHLSIPDPFRFVPVGPSYGLPSIYFPLSLFLFVSFGKSGLKGA